MRCRLRAEIRGAVQGVGFRPFVYRLAEELSLDGWVSNDSRGLTLEAEGARADLERFLARIIEEKPAAATIESTAVEWPEPAGYRGFEIRASDVLGDKSVQILPEIATCASCLREIRDPGDRRYRYPFTNCTLCGPRFSIVLSLPYDRPRTTMRRFAMCPACAEEYASPRDRRFHAQPNACPACGPRLALWRPDGQETATGDEALRLAAEALAHGAIVAVKGLGGFHLLADARDGAAVARLRERKGRREKPFAVMARDMEQARTLCRIGDLEERALSSPEAPILLLPRRAGAPAHESVAPGNAYLGVMLPYTPLHHLLLGQISFPVVATSGNLSEEPICIDENEALERLGGIADLFLVHDRPIARHVDDSVAWRVDGEIRLLRRARGYAPRPVLLASPLPPILAVGGHLKNTVALGVGRQAFISQHIGDTEAPEALAAFEAVISDFLELYEVEPVAVAHDLHPDYASTRWARSLLEGEPGAPGDAERSRTMSRLLKARLVPVQHHHAHLAACLAEHGRTGPALGVTWDGTGFGPDGTIWGGEFLVGGAASFRRVACLRRFRLPGGDAAVREPRRSALALLWEMLGEEALAQGDLPPVQSFTQAERALLGSMLRRGVHCPWTSSAGRLFDGVAALLGLAQRTTFEGQAAMAVEHVADPSVEDAYPVEMLPAEDDRAEPRVLDWRPLLEGLLRDSRRGTPVPVLAARFHNTLIEMIALMARMAGEPLVALSGGCFQNRRLVEGAAQRLRRDGFEVLIHRHVPPNDGGISLGQLVVAAATLEKKDSQE